MDSVRLIEEFGKDLGLLHEAVVTGRKVGAGRDFWSQLAHNKSLFRQVVEMVLGRTRMTEAERLAVEILGSGKVLGYRDVSRVQMAEPPEVEPVMPFPEDVLRECAEANGQGIADWRLAYVVGHSLRQERKIMGCNPKKPPCFNPKVTWWLERVHDSWTMAPVRPGYRLFDFTKRFASISWDDQQTAIAQLGIDFERAEEQAVAEICCSNVLLSPNKERLMWDWFHWGRLQTVSGGRVCVGYCGKGGFCVDYGWDRIPDRYFGVVVARKS